MVEHTPIAVSSRQLIDDSLQRADALARAQELMGEAVGTASDDDGAVEVTADGRGAMLALRVSPSALRHGDALGPLIVEVAGRAMRDAIQQSYNRVALLLGEDMTYAIEQLTGMPAPARPEDGGGGMTVEEFQRQRQRRLGRRQREAEARQADAGAEPSPAPAGGDDEEWDLDSFDASTLRSDR